MSTSGGSSGGGVSSFNTRTGAVTLAVADAEALFTAVGELLAGTGSGTGELLGIGTAGQVLTVGGADPSGLEWATPSGGGSLTTVESYITSDVTLATAGVYYNVTSVSLAAGTWLVTARALMTFGTATVTPVDIFIGPTSASVTGAYAATSVELGSGAGTVELESAVIVKSITLAVTTTVYLIGYPGNNGPVVKHASVNSSLPGATGITAVKTA